MIKELLNECFSTPIYTCPVSDQSFPVIQAELQSVVDKLKEDNLFKKNAHWDNNAVRLSHTAVNKDILEVFGVESFSQELRFHVQQYMELINAPVNKVKEFKIVQSWLTQSLDNEYAHIHTHGCMDISGVYYFKADGDEGDLFLEHTVTQMSSAWPFEHLKKPMHIKPETGRLILFPSWVSHGTIANKSNKERISLAFDIAFSREYLNN
jgi:uncharacterized protein (TIGR02466 family)